MFTYICLLFVDTKDKIKYKFTCKYQNTNKKCRNSEQFLSRRIIGNIIRNLVNLCTYHHSLEEWAQNVPPFGTHNSLQFDSIFSNWTVRKLWNLTALPRNVCCYNWALKKIEPIINLTNINAISACLKCNVQLEAQTHSTSTRLLVYII